MAQKLGHGIVFLVTRGKDALFRQAGTALGAPVLENLAAIRCLHSPTETVKFFALDLGRCL